MRVECITCDAGMERFAAEWTALWRRVPAATPFQSPAWLLAWWRHFGTGAPRLLVARDAGALAGVLPLYRRDEPHRRKLLPIGIGLSDYLDALVDPQRPAVADALLMAIAELAGWQECHLPDLPRGAVLGDAAAPAGLAERRAAGVPCPVLPLPAGADWTAAVPRKTRRDLRQAEARAAAAGGLAIESVDAAALGPALDDLFRLHEARWRARGEAGVVAAPAVRRFHQDAAGALAASGMLRLYRLTIGGRPAAVYYGFRHNFRSYAYLGGFDPDLPRLSPGALVLQHAIAQAAAEGAREFHFLRGGESYKYAWGAIDRWNAGRTLVRR